MKHGMLLGGTILMMAASSVFAAEATGELYRASEVSVDIFGSASVGEYTINNVSKAQVRNNTRLGAGMGVNYFITKNIGIGGDAYSENSSGSLIDSTSANMIFRFPLGDSGFAPYAYGGGGKQFDMSKAWFVQVGGGIEYRFSPSIGAFLDARWVIPDETKYYGVARLGVRLSF
ncbi:MAG TPA: hypothetical protein VK968_10650 [Roseimicrobium sp.]|nr:hypothetical protein [Roseimicrobium sp.]